MNDVIVYKEHTETYIGAQPQIYVSHIHDLNMTGYRS